MMAGDPSLVLMSKCHPEAGVTVYITPNGLELLCFHCEALVVSIGKNQLPMFVSEQLQGGCECCRKVQGN